ncbi:hypothetical protein N8I77_009550 [Diaporthe amygdali]|uniref:Uncharacterized protein n=1 Tax=Phomopsis amygdali TaxID=1214568 RepID=A0AAD9W123_PHOAM|nr:hypothetical protein N8I77_009550 [Diaporthe amygdali]
MSSTNAFEESKDKALEVIATHLTAEEMVDFGEYNSQGTHDPEDREKLMDLTNKHQQALYQLGQAMIDLEVEGEGALEVFTDMLALTEEALRQLRKTESPRESVVDIRDRD